MKVKVDFNKKSISDKLLAKLTKEKKELKSIKF
jgi:hypothetical protein